MPSFDFDHWSDLARRDPPAFFRERERAIAAFIDAHPEARGPLTELQARIDALRAQAATPARALRGILGLLEDHLHALEGGQRRLAHEAARLRARSREPLDRGEPDGASDP